jgi:hypothetical protein
MQAVELMYLRIEKSKKKYRNASNNSTSRDLKAPENFRPISVSTSFANIYEVLMLQNGVQILKKMDSNQFGYQENISYKHAYFAINECINYYNSKNELAQLDAE